MKRSSIPIFTLLVWLLAFASCTYKSNHYLFKTPQKITTDEPVLVIDSTSKDSAKVYRHRIKVGDRLEIRFLNNYDIGQSAQKSATSAANTEEGGGGPSTTGYLVNYDSTVTLPLIGRTNLIGLTRLEAAKKLETLYSQYINNPIIDVNIVSLSVTVLGEVNRPGKILVDRENTTLIEVIGYAGGFKDAAQKGDIRIIRGNELIITNLQQIQAARDKRIVIHDNDIVYVQPYSIKARIEPMVSAGPGITVIFQSIQLVLVSLQLYLLIKATK